LRLREDAAPVGGDASEIQGRGRCGLRVASMRAFSRAGLKKNGWMTTHPAVDPGSGNREKTTTTALSGLRFEVRHRKMSSIVGLWVETNPDF